MRTHFVRHLGCLGQIFRVIKRPILRNFYGDIVPWHPEDIAVANPERYKTEGSWFILPKSEYIPCDSEGRLLKTRQEIACDADLTQVTQSRS